MEYFLWRGVKQKCGEVKEMNEILLLLLGFIGIVAVGCSIALIALGTMIDRFPSGNDKTRSRSIASPVETTKIFTILFWIFFIPGGWAVLQENRYVMVAGITTVFSVCLFMVTALGFSFAVLNTMRGKKKGTLVPDGMPVVHIAPAAPAAAEYTPSPVLRKRYNNPVTDFMLNALLKKE